MTYTFLFPSDPLSPKKIDSVFWDEARHLDQAGHTVCVLAPDNKSIRGDLPEAQLVVYRGWMLSEREYEELNATIHCYGGQPLTNTIQYLNAHHIPRWYPLISDLTAETVFFPADCDLESELRKLNWAAFFMKDYVKSLKTASGSYIMDPAQASQTLAEMRHFRGTIEGGLSVRKAEPFRFDFEERRFFVRHGQVMGAGPLIPIPEIVLECSERLSPHTPFFSVDIAELEDGTLRVVEIGDGQVSDWVGWTIERFVEFWKDEHLRTR